MGSQLPKERKRLVSIIFGVAVAVLVVLLLLTVPVVPSKSTTATYVLQGHPCSSGTVGPECILTAEFSTRQNAVVSIEWTTKPSTVAMSLFSVIGPDGQFLSVAANFGGVDFTSTGGSYGVLPSTVSPANVTIVVVVIEPSSSLI
jgi:hypothetical protein